MRATLVQVLLILMLIFAPGPAVLAEEELFDTKGAAEHVEKGLVQMRAKNYDAAIEEFAEAVAMAPDAESYYLLGYAYYMKGKTGDEESRKNAIENFGQAYQIDPNFTPSKFKPEDLVAPGAAEGVAPSLGAMAPAGKQDAAALPSQPPAAGEPPKQ